MVFICGSNGFVRRFRRQLFRHLEKDNNRRRDNLRYEKQLSPALERAQAGGGIGPFRARVSLRFVQELENSRPFTQPPLHNFGFAQHLSGTVFRCRKILRGRK